MELQTELNKFYETNSEMIQSKIRNGIIEYFYEYPLRIKIEFPPNSRIGKCFNADCIHTFPDGMKITLYQDGDVYYGILSELSLTILTDDFIRDLSSLALDFITDPPFEIANIETLTEEFERVLDFATQKVDSNVDYTLAVELYNSKLDLFVKKLIEFRYSVLRHFTNQNYLSYLDRRIEQLKMSRISI